MVVRTTLIFFTLFVFARVLGKKQLSQLTFFNYVTGITIGSIAGNIISDSNKPFVDEFLGLAWWCLLTMLISFIGLKFGNIRKIINGQPVILIKNGKLIREALKSNSLNLDDLSMMLREKDVFAITEVEYAILEPNGNVSVMKKIGNEQVTKSDMKISGPKKRYLPAQIIVDGNIVKHALQEFDKDEKWLMKQLKQSNIQSKDDVFYAELQENGTLYIEKY